MTTERLNDLRNRWLIFLLLFALYLLIYTGVPDSADGKALLAVATALVRQGDADISAFGAEDARFEFERSRMGVFGQDGGYYSKKGITPSLALIPLVAFAQVMPWLSTSALAMLLNVVVTAATAVVVYTLVREMCYRPRVALIVTLIYGVATTALVYAKTLYGEPLAGLLLVGALLAAYRYRQSQQRRELVIVGALVGLAMGINLTYALMLPIIGVYALSKQKISREMVWKGVYLVAPFTLLLVGIGIYNAARFGSPLTSGYYFSSGEGFNKPFLAGLFGLTLSPYRGIFWYSPVLLLALPGWFWLRRQQAALAWVVGALVIAQIASYASWWSWHGGITWGPRFLVPIIPLMALALAPVVERAAALRPLRWGLIALVMVSVGVQLLGALYSYFPYTGHLMRTYPAGAGDDIIDSLSNRVLSDPAASPIMGHLGMLLEGAALDPAWLANGIQPVIPLAAALVLAAAIYLTPLPLPRLHSVERGSQSRRDDDPPRKMGFQSPLSTEWRGDLGVRLNYTPFIGVMAVVIAVFLMAGCGVGADCQQADALEQTLQPVATTVIASADFEPILPDVTTGRMMSVNAPTSPDDVLASRMWANALRHAGDGLLWYVTWFPPADAQNWQERELWTSAAFAVQRDADGHRALLFHLDPPQPQIVGAIMTFGDIALVGQSIEMGDGGIFISLAWQVQTAVDGDYTWFVHVIDANGSIVAQQDRAPQGGFAPTSGWMAEQRVIDYLYFPLDAAVAGRAVAFRVGWIDPMTGERLVTRDAGGAIVDEAFMVILLR